MPSPVGRERSERPVQAHGSQLGHGNFASGVHLAEHVDLGRKVAIKLLRLEFVTDRDQLLDEARKMAALDEHDHVVKVIDAGDWDANHVFIASEVCPGGSLGELAVAGPLDPAKASKFISDACRGLDHMHRHGLVHLDVRPANLLIGRDGRVKVVDFGLARWVKNPGVDQFYAPHAAPEILSSWTGSEAADQYSTAMSLAHLLTGGAACANPPLGDAIAAAIRSGAWPHVETLNVNIPDRLKKVVARATSDDPADRYDSIEHFKRALDRATPKVSFTVDAGGRLTSADGEWTITTISFSTKGAYTVEVKRRGRRVKRLGVEGLTEKQTCRHVKDLVKLFAYGELA